MNIMQLQYLIDVGEMGSFTDAARKNHITVPAISQSVSQLEAELNTPLFVRSKKGVVPTEQGMRAIQHALSILRSVDKMKQELADSQLISQGNIMIATIPGIVSQVVSTTIEFTEYNPLVNVNLIEGDTKSVLRRVRSGQADMGFVSLDANHYDEALAWEPITRGAAVLVVNKKSQLRFHKTITGHELEHQVFVLYNDPFLRRIAQHLLTNNPSNRIALTTNNLEALFQMVTQGNAISLGPDYIVSALPVHLQEELVTIPLSGYDSSPSYLWRVTRKNVEVPGVIEQFTAKLLAHFHA
ncbi:LysR family transcriptional regulator [Paenibacillus tarimensis]|uniref:LysR family transcriptional regulator n=1 Tax=Paenibacillus tarimensis TaxID=416012 RepID=UPI001F23A023|nr:LysR family transcriptional regulator [Paenibacillus tarimensis]MCF2945575.1 LysR family transcriptional regulator [Paenibacillus tarimensis]